LHLPFFITPKAKRSWAKRSNAKKYGTACKTKKEEQGLLPFFITPPFCLWQKVSQQSSRSLIFFAGTATALQLTLPLGGAQQRKGLK
jgi:hypothetical protein